MSNTSFLSKNFSRLINLAKLYERNLSNFDFLIFHEDKRKDVLMSVFKAPIYDHNFAHLVGLSPTDEFRHLLRRLHKHIQPSVAIYESILKEDADILNWVQASRDITLTEKKIISAEQIFNFPDTENIYFADEHLKEINILSDKFINKFNYSLGFAFDDDRGEYYIETNLNRNRKQRIQKPLEIYAVIRSNHFLSYEITMCKGKTLNKEFKKQILMEFLRIENLLGEPEFLSKVKFIENDIYNNQFKELWEDFLEFLGLSSLSPKCKDIDLEQPSLDDEIADSSVASKQLSALNKHKIPYKYNIEPIL